MEIKRTNIDDLNFRLALEVSKEDYSEKKRKALNDYRRQAEIRGFRKGMAPVSLIEKMHGMQALVESVNSIISESLNKYITDNNLNILGEPLPNDELQQKINWDKDEKYEFIFDCALAPEVKVALGKSDKIDSYEVEVSEEAKNNYKSNMLRQFGKLEPAEVVEEEDFIVADLLQNSEVKVAGTYITLKTIENKTIKKKFIGKKVGDKFVVDVNKAFANEVDRAALLKLKKEDLTAIDPEYEVEIKEIKRVIEATPGIEIYDRMFGKGEVKNEQEFEAKIAERIAAEYQRECDFRFMLDAKEYLIKKTDIKVPEAFMKRWLFNINEGKITMADIEKEFDLFLKDFRWQLIRQFIMKEQKYEIKREDLVLAAKQVASYQFAMYGLNDVPDEQLTKYAESILANEKEGRRIYEKAEEDLVLKYVKETVSLNTKKITADELQKLNA
jgi:trigger factor